MCMAIHILDPSKRSRSNTPQGWKCPGAFYRGDESGKELVGGVLRRELPAVTLFSMASPGTNELTGKCWEQAVTQLALCLTPGEEEPQIRIPF